jgi:hypothetical protein
MKAMNPPNIVAKAVYFIEGDVNAFEYQSMVIEHEGSLWLVATWLISNDTGTRYPERIVPMEKLPHVVQQDGLIRLGLLMPRALVSADAPIALLLQYGAAIHPGIDHLPGPSSTH